MKKLTTLLILICIISTQAQDVITCTNDSIKLKTKNYKFGIIEWERSSDGNNWEKIESEFDTTYVFKPVKTNYYRAVNKLPSCSPIYSSQTLILRPPISNAGSDRAINDNSLFLSGNIEPLSTGTWSVLEGANGTFEDNTVANTKFTGETGSYELVWRLENSCGFSTDTVSVEILKNKYYDKIVIVDETDKILSTDEEIENGNYKIEFSDPVPIIDNETILIGTTGFGYLRKVTAVSQTDNTFTMETSQGKLDDILLDGGLDIGKIISLDTTITSAKTGYKKLTKRPTRKEILTNKKLKTGVHYFLIEEKVKSLGNNVKLKKKSNQTDEITELGFALSGDLVKENGILVNLTGSLNFTPNLYTTINKNIFRPEFSLGLENAKLKNEFNFTLKGDFETSAEKKFNLFSYIKAVYVLVSGVPVLLTTEIDFEGKVNAETKANLLFTHKFTNTITANARIAYENKTWKRDFTSSTVNELDTNLEVKGSFLQKLEIGPRISFKVYAIAGPYSEFKITQKFNACAKGEDFKPLNWNSNFDIGTKITAGVEAKMFGLSLDYSKTWERDGLYSLKFPYELDYFLGNNQLYVKGETLDNMPMVRVINNKGKPVQFVSVKFEVEENSTDIVSEEYVFTDIDGYARTAWTPNTDNSSKLKVSVVDCNDKNISNSPFIFTATEVQTIDCSETTLSASYEIENNILTPIAIRGVAPYTYSTDNITFSTERPEITIVAGQTYTLYIKDSNGCIASKSYINKPFTCEDSTLDLEISTYNNNIDITGIGGKPPYEYSIDNGNSFSTNETFYDLENQEYNIVIKDANGCEKSSTLNLETNNLELSAYFEYENDNGLVTFKNLSTGADSYEWDFGDGNTSTNPSPIHYFSIEGFYTIGLKTIDSFGNSYIFTKTININIVDSTKVFQGDIRLQTQADVNALGENKFTVINGYLWIGSSSDIVNLNPLNTIKLTTGSLIISQNNTLENLEGLNSLNAVQTIFINYNSNLTNIDALSNISNLGIDITLYSLGINNNPNLTNLDGLSGITYIDGFSNIIDNQSLVSLEGLSNIKRMNYSLEIINNNKLTNLSGLAMSMGGLFLTNNDGLTSLKGLENLISITSLSISNNSQLLNLNGIENLNNISGNFSINANENLSDFCAISSLINTNGLKGNLSISGNAYNPTRTQIQNSGSGGCKE